jgi:hypothetical protein
MKTRKFALLLVSLAFASCNPAPKPETEKPAAAPVGIVHGNLAQVMRAIMFPNSNVIFFVQDKDPKSIKPAKDPSTAVNIMESTYGGWEAVENSSLALAESANLLMIPGRKCSNGKDVPMNSPDWPKLVQGLRDAGMTAYKAAQTKNMDNILMATDALTTACGNCHEKYRDKQNNADRCM